MQIENNRRNFLKKIGVSTVPFLVPTLDVLAAPSNSIIKRPEVPLNFIYDGLTMSPAEYLAKLQEINSKQAIQIDYYGAGGPTKKLEEAFAKATGKEKAIYLPTGTMANQLAIKLLSGANTKVIVPENSHVFRDEADAAQSVHHKRLVPVGKGKPHFDLQDLINTIEYNNQNEVFKSGLGTVVIENPIRRADGAFMPIEEIKAIASYCQKNGYKMHLDGARIHLAAAFSKVSLAEYAAHFDTVYISLYKYLNAAGGAILCGDAALINQVPHQIKIHGGTMFQNWNNTSMALHYLEGIEGRWEEIVKQATNLISDLNEMDGLEINALKNGSNIYDLKLADKYSLKKLANYLYEEHNIWLGRANEEKIVKFFINESFSSRDNQEILAAMKMGMEEARQ